MKQRISEWKVIVDSTASNTRALPRPVKLMDLPQGQTTVQVNLWRQRILLAVRIIVDTKKGFVEMQEPLENALMILNEFDH